MDIAAKILSDITIYTKYSRYLDNEKRRETWDEIITRNMMMHFEKYPMLENEMLKNFQLVYDKKVLPSMRGLQFAGKPISIMPTRQFNCLKRDTPFITSKGVKTFENFKDGEETVVLTHLGNWKKATVKCYGKDKLFPITFQKGSNKTKVWATKNHRWILRDSQETTSLKVGDLLHPSPSIFYDFDYDLSKEPFEKLYWCYGYVFGDGTRVKDSKGGPMHSMVRLCDQDRKFKERFEEMGFSTSSPLSCKGDFIAYTGTYLKTVPDPKVDNPNLIRAFVRGYLDADGHRKLKSAGYANLFCGIQTSEKDHQNFIDECFGISGVYITRKKDLTGQITNYGTRPETYMYGLYQNISVKHPGTFWRVSELCEEFIEEDVWCLEVEDDHSFVLKNGIVTGNCSAMPINDWRCFSELMFLLLGGTGVGISVQRHHVEQLPEVRFPLKRKRRYLIADSIEGWSESIKVLFKAYFLSTSDPEFDFRDIRQKGSRLITSGGKAPGPEPLKKCLNNIRALLDRKEVGSKLTPLEAHDLCCIIADAVLAGGIRRSALISLFSLDDEEMMSCKSGKWYETDPQRARANNSVVLVRHRISEDVFKDLWKKIELSRSGEPGFTFSNDIEYLLNPCAEASLRAWGMCNLTEVNVSDVESQEDLNERVRVAAFIGTLQAGYTNFHYLRDCWKKSVEKDALLGIGMTGIASNMVQKLDLKQAVQIAINENKRVAKLIGIKPAQRLTCVKPSGSSSCVLGCSSGIHAWHSPYYIRRMRVGKNEAIYTYLKNTLPQLLEDDHFKPSSQACICIPIKSPENAIMRDESPIELLERVKYFNENWIRPGHLGGSNTHAVSATVSIKDEQWETVGKWMWANREYYNGISVLPYDGGTYVQAPFEECSKERYEELFQYLTQIDLSKVTELEDETELQGEAACTAGGCSI